jgi:ABC-type transport system substrate-binding protein
MTQLLGGLMQPAVGLLTPSSPWFGTPSFRIRHDVAEARRLMAEVGFTPQRPLQTKVLIPAQGSGMMQPIPMNEAIQQGLREAGIAVTFEVVEWNALQAAWRAGSRDPLSRGASAHNNSYFSQDPFTALIRHLDSSLVTPRGTNWGWYQDATMDGLFERMRTGFAEGAIDRAAAEAHAKIVDDALFLFVAHDLNARAMHPRVRGFVQARNWFQDLGPVSIG